MQNVEEITLNEPTQKWEEPFRDMLDEIYWPGYAENLAKENPKAYNIEYYNFMALYSYAPSK